MTKREERSDAAISTLNNVGQASRLSTKKKGLVYYDRKGHDASCLEELTNILQISEPLAQKIIALREELGGFKEPKDLTQLPEITNLEGEEWIEKGITITVE